MAKKQVLQNRQTRESASRWPRTKPFKKRSREDEDENGSENGIKHKIKHR